MKKKILLLSGVVLAFVSATSQHSVDQRSVDQHTVGQHTADQHSVDQHTVGQHTADEHSDGPGSLDSLRIISYNIWNGFDWGKDLDRLADFQHWMAAQDCDVAALQELCGYTPERLEEEATEWRHSNTLLLKESGYSVGLSSKQPIELVERIRKGLHHGALHCRTMGLDFLVVHLHPGSIERRREEAKILEEKIRAIQSEGRSLVVLGDFNAHSPIDSTLYDPQGPLLTRLRESNKDKKGASGNLEEGNLDYAVISTFLSLGLLDPVPDHAATLEERGSFPAMALSDLNEESQKHLWARLERIDYILLSEDLMRKCQSARVLNGKENWFLSDHYPVMADFILNTP